MRIRSIINPTAGRQLIQYNAKQIVRQLLADGTASKADVIETRQRGDAYRAALDPETACADLVLAAGGDGTVNEVVNGLVDGGHDVPLAVIAAGTANDFAYSMKLPKGVNAYCSMIRQYKTRRLDIGRIGKHCFMNVAAAGILTDISFKVPSEAKTLFGQFAYFMSGVFDLSFQYDKSMPLTIKADGKTIEDDILLLIVTNISSVGGFRKVAPKADPGDGLFDVLVLPRQDLRDVAPLFVLMGSGEHLNNGKILYFQSSRIEIGCRDFGPIQLDLDGEKGPLLPAVIDVVPLAVKILIP